jgi:hypothetical protein
MTIDPERVRSSQLYSTFSPHQKVLLWIYYLSKEEVRPVFLSELINLTGMSKPTVHRYVSELEDFEYIRNSIVKIPKEKNARGSKWGLKIELANGETETYAKRLYQTVKEVFQ